MRYLDLVPPFRADGLGIFFTEDYFGLLGHTPDNFRIRAIDSQLNFTTQGRTKVKFLDVNNCIRQHLLQIILYLLLRLINELVVIHGDQQIGVLICRLHRCIIGENKTGMTAANG